MTDFSCFRWENSPTAHRSAVSGDSCPEVVRVHDDVEHFVVKGWSKNAAWYGTCFLLFDVVFVPWEEGILVGIGQMNLTTDMACGQGPRYVRLPLKFFPFLARFQDYPLATLGAVLGAGVAVVLVLIPQSVAYAQLRMEQR